MLLAVAAAAQAAAAPQAIGFEAAVRRALERNPVAQIAMEEVRRADALLAEARAQSLPTLTGTVIYTRLDEDRILNGMPPRVVAAADQLSATGVLSVPLVTPRGWVQWSHAKDNVEVARLSAADVRRQLALATARAYLTVLATRRVVDVSRLARDAARAHHEFAQKRLGGGIGNRIDEVRAGQELATDEAQLEAAQAALARAREALGVLVGADGPLDTADEPALGTPPSAADALLSVERSRADVRAAATRLQAAERVSRDDYTDYLPALSGIFAPFYQNPPTLTQPLTGWQAQLILTIPLYDGGLRYGLHRERAALESEARTTLEGALRQAQSEVRSAFETMTRADRALLSARSAAQLAHEALDLAQLAYRAGATTNLEVIDAERRARDADLGAVIAEDGARQARLDLLAASGRFP